MLLLGTLAAEARGEPLSEAHPLILQLGPRARATCHPGSDGISARIEIDGVARQALRAQGRSVRVGPYHLWFEERLNHHVIGVADGERGTVRCKVQHAAGRIHLLVGRVDRIEQLRQLQRSLLDDTWVRTMHGDPLALRVENMLKDLVPRRGFSPILEQLRRLPGQRRYQSYKQLRTADVHLLAGRVPTAHAQYQSLGRQLGDRGAKLLAVARAAELSYIADDTDPQRDILSPLRHGDDPLLREARDRIAHVMLQTNQLEPGLQICPDDDHNLAHQIVSAHIRRLLGQGRSFEAVLFYKRHFKRWRDAFQRPELLRLAARAHMALGLSDEAIPLLQQGLALVREATDKERFLRQLVHAYRLAGESYRARQSADYYLVRFGDGPALASVLLCRAALRLEEGDLVGAGEDLARLPDERGPTRTRLEALLSVQRGVLPPAGAATMAELEHRQRQLLQQLERKARR